MGETAGLVDSRWITYCEDDGPDIVVKTRRSYGFLMRLWGARFLTENKSGPDPDSAGPKHQRGSQRLPVEETTRGDNLYLIASQRAFLAFDQFGHGRN